jgi:hypothetical protein
MLQYIMRKKHTGEQARHRKDRQEERRKHIRAIEANEVTEELPEILLPDIFAEIRETYWESLKSVPDPRSRDKRVYPLHMILHRIISGFVEGNKYIGVLFPKKRTNIETGKKKLGALPTRKAVYTLLRRIDWSEADKFLAPLWERLGYAPDMIVRREFRNPTEIVGEFREERKRAESEKRKRLREEHEAAESSKGMSAAKAKRSVSKKSEDKELSGKSELSERESVALIAVFDDPMSEGKAANSEMSFRKPESSEHECVVTSVATHHDLVVDGKVVKASYNSGVKEHIVHVTEIRRSENDERSRFIIGARPTETGKNGEWGAAVSILETLTPLPRDKVVVVSGDAGFCVEEFVGWLNENDFFLLISNKRERR